MSTVARAPLSLAPPSHVCFDNMVLLQLILLKLLLMLAAKLLPMVVEMFQVTLTKLAL